jgi:hypothetical protein
LRSLGGSAMKVERKLPLEAALQRAEGNKRSGAEAGLCNSLVGTMTCSVFKRQRQVPGERRSAHCQV